jgi:hypothetical protein
VPGLVASVADLISRIRSEIGGCGCATVAREAYARLDPYARHLFIGEQFAMQIVQRCRTVADHALSQRPVTVIIANCSAKIQHLCRATGWPVVTQCVLRPLPEGDKAVIAVPLYRHAARDQPNPNREERRVNGGDNEDL